MFYSPQFSFMGEKSISRFLSLQRSNSLCSDDILKSKSPSKFSSSTVCRGLYYAICLHKWLAYLLGTVT